MSTSIPWFRYGVKETRRILRRSKHPYDRGLWRDALHRSKRLREKRLQGAR
jgi:hypothetical protein